MNKNINDKQCTVVWHVDDLLISHVDPNVVTDILYELSKKYEELMPLTINIGKIHEYLGMVFDFSTDDKVMITIYQCIDSVVEGALDIYKVSSREAGVEMATPDPSNLYDIRDPNNENVTRIRLLIEAEHEEYHTLTAQYLYLSKRGRPYL